MPLLDVAGFDWSQADYLIGAARSPTARRLEGIASAAGCRVVGFGARPELAGYTPLEGAVPVALHRVLAPIQRDTPLEFLAVTAMLPVTVAGEAGVAELASQTRALFSMEPIEPEVFPLQIAFNVIPQVGPMATDGAGLYETQVATELKSLLARPDLPVAVTALWAPLFYGSGVVVHAVTRDELDLERLRKRLAGQEGVTVMDTALPGGVPTPGTDAQDSDEVFVGRLRRSGDSSRHFSMWLVLDAARMEATRIVDWVENSIEK
jgi:aspartate-semialdehyde dehydrogenase